MSTIIKSKTRVLGDGLNCRDLLEAISHPEFKNNAPVQIRCEQYVGWLRMVCQCENCSRLHFITGELDEETYLQNITHHRIYADHYSDGDVTTKEELMAILSEISPETEIVLETSLGGIAYKLTLVYQCCQECPCIHLDCYYEKDAIIPN